MAATSKAAINNENNGYMWRIISKYNNNNMKNNNGESNNEIMAIMKIMK